MFLCVYVCLVWRSVCDGLRADTRGTRLRGGLSVQVCPWVYVGKCVCGTRRVESTSPGRGRGL